MYDLETIYMLYFRLAKASTVNSVLLVYFSSIISAQSVNPISLRPLSISLTFSLSFTVGALLAFQPNSNFVVNSAFIVSEAHIRPRSDMLLAAITIVVVGMLRYIGNTIQLFFSRLISRANIARLPSVRTADSFFVAVVVDAAKKKKNNDLLALTHSF